MSSLTLADRTFTFGQIPAMEAVRIEVAIARVIGEPLFKAFMDRKDAGADQAAMMHAAGAAVGLLTSKMNPDELVTTIEAVMKYVRVDGKRVEVNSAFTGRNKELWQVFIAALKYNFSDFFTDGLFGSALSEAVTK